MALGLPLLGRAGEGGLEFGPTLKFQLPLGEYKSEVLDTQFGFGFGLRTHVQLHPSHALTARIDYDSFIESKQIGQGPNYGIQITTQIHEVSLGLTYEWHYTGTRVGGYLLLGPVYRSWNEKKEYIYYLNAPGDPAPDNQTLTTTPSRLGLDLGWGFRSATDTAVELHLILSKYGDTDLTANTLQLSVSQYW